MSSLEVLDGVKELEILPQRPGNGAQTSDVLGMPPAGIVPAAVRAGDEGYGHSAPPASAYRTATTMSKQQDGSVLDAKVGEFANELLSELLPARDFGAVDRLEVPDKLLIGTRLATGQSPLSRCAQPLQDVAIVVKTRNRLVHAKPQNGIAAWIRDVTAADEAAVGPDAALKALVRVSEAIVLCTELREYPNLHGGVAKTIVNYRQLLVRHKDHAGPKIANVPAQDAESVAPLWDQMQEAIAARAGLRRGDHQAIP